MGQKISPVHVGIVGCGRIVKLVHLRNLLESPDVRVVAMADADPAARREMASRAPQARIVETADELFALSGLDAVVIALPTPEHRRTAVAAFERGLHVYLEKPIAESPEDGQAIVEAWRRAGTVGVIGFNCRFNCLYRDMRDALARGAIGAPVAARSALTALWPGDGAWRGRSASGGGALLELASHHVDLYRFLFDTEVTHARGVTWSDQGTDAAMLLLTLGNGLHAQVLCAHGTVEEDRFEVYGAIGKLVLNRYDSLVIEQVTAHARGGLLSAARHLVREVGAIGYGLEKRRVPGQEPSFRVAIRAFLTAVRTNRQSRPDLDDGLRALIAIDQARAAAREEPV